MNPEDLAQWYADFFSALMSTGTFTEEQAMTIILRVVPKGIAEKKVDPRKLLKQKIK